MNRNYLHRCTLRFPRTASSAFRDYRYGACIEIPTRPSLLRRILRAVLGWL